MLLSLLLRRLLWGMQAKAGSEHPVDGISLTRQPPLLQLLGERRELHRVRIHDLHLVGERRKPRVHRRARPRGAALPAPGRQAAPDEPPRAGVDETVEQDAHDRLGRACPIVKRKLSTNEARHRAPEQSHALAVARIDRDRPPARQPAVLASLETREHTPTREQPERELGSLSKEAQRVADGDARAILEGQGEQHVYRCGR